MPPQPSRSSSRSSVAGRERVPDSWLTRYGGHGRGVMQRGIAGWVPLFGLSQSNSTFFHSAGESNDARRHLNTAEPNDVSSLEKPARRNETCSPANLASSNDVS